VKRKNAFRRSDRASYPEKKGGRKDGYRAERAKGEAAKKKKHPTPPINTAKGEGGGTGSLFVEDGEKRKDLLSFTIR